MTLKYGFYNSLSGDRLYNAEDISTIFNGVITDGIFAAWGGSFVVSAVASQMNVSVATGRAWFNDTWTSSDSAIVLAIDAAEAVLNRIDLVILEVDKSTSIRANSIKVVKGTPASTPVAPTLTTSGTLFQYALCEVYVGAAVTSLVQGNITNKIGTGATPFVTGPLTTIGVDDLFTQFEEQFDTWFTNLQDQLDSNQAANLQNQIDAINALINSGAIGGGTEYNYIINGGFDFANRQSPAQATLTTYAANTYSADRWKTWAENASYQYARAVGVSEAGLTSLYHGVFKKITNAGKMMHYQIIEGEQSIALRGKEVTFQVQMKASSAKTIRMGIFELQSAGTMNSIPNPIVTAAGANTVDPTMGTNVAIITGAQSKSVTTAMQVFSVTVTVPATSKNLICAIWSDSQFAVNDAIYIAEAGLYVNANEQDWKPRLEQAELALCQRYCYVSPDGSAPYGETGFWNMATSTSRVTILSPHAVDMIKPPSFSTSGNFRVDDGTTATNVLSFTFSNSSKQRTAFYADVSGTPLTQYRPYKLSANNDLTAKLIFDAEL